MTLAQAMEKAAREIDAYFVRGNDESLLKMIASGMSEADALDLLDWMREQKCPSARGKACGNPRDPGEGVSLMIAPSRRLRNQRPRDSFNAL